MSDRGSHGVQASRTLAVAAALALLLVIAASLAVQTWRGSGQGLADGLGPIGALHSVLLTNNQVYYGTLEKVAPGYIVLTRVFYVQVVTDPQTKERANKLVERATTDWHAPLSMTIPIDKIQFAEIVGSASNVAKLIAQAKGDR